MNFRGRTEETASLKTMVLLINTSEELSSSYSSVFVPLAVNLRLCTPLLVDTQQAPGHSSPHSPGNRGEESTDHKRMVRV